MRVNRLITAVLSFALLLSAAACSSAGNTMPDAADSDTSQGVAAEGISADSPSADALPADDDYLDRLSYEVKFLLDPQKVLDDAHLLTEDWRQTFGITEDYQPIEVMYLETPEKDFLQEGWINRLRLKSGKKKVERTYKKRYPVSGEDIAAALKTAEQEGFVLPEKTEKKAQKDEETAKGVFEAGIDWGYEKMTLSFSTEDSAKMKGHDSLTSVTDDEAKAFLLSAMPDIEADWKQSQWGITTLDRSMAVGPVRLLRAKGMLENREVTVEICPVTTKDKEEESYIVELSFKADDFEEASDGRAQLTEYLDQKGILLHEDSLKTTKILDAWF